MNELIGSVVIALLMVSPILLYFYNELVIQPREARRVREEQVKRAMEAAMEWIKRHEDHRH